MLFPGPCAKATLTAASADAAARRAAPLQHGVREPPLTSALREAGGVRGVPARRVAWRCEATWQSAHRCRAVRRDAAAVEAGAVRARAAAPAVAQCRRA
jgi:hypothetical protein